MRHILGGADPWKQINLAKDQVHFRHMKLRSRFTPVDAHALPMRSSVLPLDTYRYKCIWTPYVHLPHYDSCRSDKIRSFDEPYIVLTLDACRPKCVSDILKCALAPRLSFQTHLRHAETSFRSTRVDPNENRQNAIQSFASNAFCQAGTI